MGHSQSGNGYPPATPQELNPSSGEDRDPVNRGGAQRSSHCQGDTVFYEDFSNGFAGANALGIGWDTSGTYVAWRECSNACPTNGSSSDLSSYVNTPTQGNGLIHMDIQWKAGYVDSSSGPAPEQYMTMDDVVVLSGLKAPVVTLHSTFSHCCGTGHEILLEVDTNMNGTWDASFDMAAKVGKDEVEGGMFSYHLAPVIQGNADSVRIRFTWPPTGAG